MRNLFLLSLLIICLKSGAQPVIRAFPITDYIVDLDDSVKIVQIRLSETGLVAEKQIGLLKGIYRDKFSDTATIGTGRCHLIKGEYYYFTINSRKSDVIPKEGDLLYTAANKPLVYDGLLLKLAIHFIGFQDVYESAWYDRYRIFSGWTEKQEKAVLDSMLKDIQFTGKYFLENNPSMNIKINGGRYDGKMVLNTMIACNSKDVADFLEYMLALPRSYAGHEWKISEIFATWLGAGAPSVIKE